MERVAFIGFGEAARAFADGMPFAAAQAFDIKAMLPGEGPAFGDAAHAHRVSLVTSSAAAVADAMVVFSLVTADQAVDAAIAVAPHLREGSLFIDGNSVAPATKARAAAVVTAAGARYVDMAIMAPVLPQRRGVPVLVSGPDANAAELVLGTLGFAQVRLLDGPVGRASMVKMIRSVMIKGIEALTAECLLAADAAGVLDAVIASLDETEAPRGWAVRADYNLERMMAHGLRRAEEMREVALTLDGLQTGSEMARATLARQREIGERGIAPPEGLAAKLRVLTTDQRAAAA